MLELEVAVAAGLVVVADVVVVEASELLKQHSKGQSYYSQPRRMEYVIQRRDYPTAKACTCTPQMSRRSRCCYRGRC